LDIETTGLSPTYTEVILVGLIYNKNSVWYITQLFCEHRNEEKELLLALMDYIQPNHLLVTYNGHAFDLPYLNKRYAIHNIDFSFSMIKHFDLYRVVRASKKALNLESYKLKAIEEFLGIFRDDQISGKESVELYEQYEQNPNKDLRHTILLHNYDDIKFMIPTMDILNHIPLEITSRFYPFSYTIDTLGQCILSRYEHLKDYIELAFICETIESRVDYRDGFSYDHNHQLIKVKIPIFKVEERTFIDIDLLPFTAFDFNELDYLEQLTLEITTKKDGFEAILNLLEKHYY